MWYTNWAHAMCWGSTCFHRGQASGVHLFSNGADVTSAGGLSSCVVILVRILGVSFCRDSGRHQHNRLHRGGVTQNKVTHRSRMVLSSWNLSTRNATWNTLDRNWIIFFESYWNSVPLSRMPGAGVPCSLLNGEEEKEGWRSGTVS